MATRTISTRLAIEGESAYKTAVKACSNEMKTLRSELALVQSQYQNQANSMQALTAKGQVLAKTYESQENKVKT